MDPLRHWNSPAAARAGVRSRQARSWSADARIHAEAGDLLYCPRGLFHSARSTDEASLHITLGLIGKTWTDVMIEAVSAACLASPAFRANLPIGFANEGFDATEASATFRSLVDMFAREAQLAPILERMTEEFVTSRRPALQGCLQEELKSEPRWRAGGTTARPRLSAARRQGRACVGVWGDGDHAPRVCARRRKVRPCGPPFVVHDLPGQLDDAGKVVLVRRLLREGLLVRQDEALE